MLAYGKWTDADFGYDPDYDFFAQRKHIERSDGKTLYSVPTLQSKSIFSVHFCSDSEEVWVVDLHKMSMVFDFDKKFVMYVPAKKGHGLPSARGYCVPCLHLTDFAKCKPMPASVSTRIRREREKGSAGIVTEKLFEWLANTRGFFSEFFTGTAARASRDDDYKNGIDFWIGAIPVQVKIDAPGGTKKTGNLFFQTHTLSVADVAIWHNFNLPESP
jgi:hypothetical protein